tara:strand:+ start:112 stop:912 length:801 start_codon:yes stop_codon:yes gene_type:complete
MEVNKIYNESNLVTMEIMEDDFLDLTVTSPPYDNLRTYKGFDFDWQKVIKELYRVTKKGGVVVWVVGDATIKGSETGTSFKQALFFKEIGFNLHDTMIYRKKSIGMPSNVRYYNIFEYMFIFSKGKPKTFNPIYEDYSEKTKERRKNKYKLYRKNKKAENIKHKEFTLNPKGVMLKNVWDVQNGFKGDLGKFKHPAMFPEQLANDHIISWSNENDIIYDPFMGSGTTAKMAKINNRNYIGSEISKEYCDIIAERLACVEGKENNCT